VEIVESLIFTRKIRDILSDDEYKELQWTLIANPAVGAIIPGGHGLRKLRWGISGSGKSGGLRIIYYCFLTEEKIYLILPYKKSEQDDLTKAQLKVLSDHVKDGVL
jgi:hypothetical protein